MCAVLVRRYTSQDGMLAREATADKNSTSASWLLRQLRCKVALLVIFGTVVSPFGPPKCVFKTSLYLCRTASCVYMLTT